MGALTHRIQAIHHLHPVRDPEDVSAVRRQVGETAQRHGLGAALVARAELAVTEIATNILGHAGGRGYILFRAIGASTDAGVEMIGVDRGPGIDDLPHALADRTPADFEQMLQQDKRPQGIGAGLSAVRRLATEFDIWSRPGNGTVVLARIHGGARPARRGCRIGGVSVALEGFGVVSGDGWTMAADDAECSVAIVDGLGHGPAAHEAALAALAVFAKEYRTDLRQYIPLANDAMRSTRGGVVGLCRVDRRHNKAQFVGVGNIEGRILLGGKVQGLASRNGTLGIDMAPPPTRMMEYGWAPDAVAILHTDGISARFDDENLRDLIAHDPATIAAMIHRDHARGRDDASVVVVKDGGGAVA